MFKDSTVSLDLTNINVVLVFKCAQTENTRLSSLVKLFVQLSFR